MRRGYANSALCSSANALGDSGLNDFASMSSRPRVTPRRAAVLILALVSAATGLLSPYYQKMFIEGLMLGPPALLPLFYFKGLAVIG